MYYICTTSFLPLISDLEINANKYACPFITYNAKFD